MGNRQLFPEKSAKELLDEFRSSGSQEPYEEIVRRYAGMVFGVCLRVTGDKHDAEDATQAVFLSLALQAKTSREITYVGPWLQKVAHRLALDVKKAKTRRKRREEKLVEQARYSVTGGGGSNGNGKHFLGMNGNGSAFTGGNGHGMNPADAPGHEELKTILMEELNQLPAKYRMPLVMHYFGGLSREEMAEQLGCNPSTLGVRVHRGKAMLGTRLAKRGIAISAVMMTVLLEHVVRTMATQPIISTASASAGGLVAGNGMGVALASAKVIGIVQSALRSVSYAKLRYAVIILLVIGSAAFATGSEVVRQIKQHLPSINVVDWIKPLFRSIVPSLRADAGEDAKDPAAKYESLDVAIEKTPRILVNLDALGSTVAAAAPTPITTVARSAAAAKTQATNEPSSALASPKMNAVALAMIDPPVLSKGANRSAGASDVGVQSRDSSSRSDASSFDASKSSVLASAGTDLYLGGAGGGGGAGKPQLYVLPANTSLSMRNEIIGDTGLAVFHQAGGANNIAGTLAVGRQKGSVGTYQLDAGSVNAKNEIIGDGGDGSFIQMNGVNFAHDSIIIGNSGSGAYDQQGGNTMIAYSAAPSSSSSDGGARPQGLVLGADAAGNGTYLLADGTLSADPQKIGDSGSGKLVQSGGTNSTGTIDIASKPGSTGQYVLAGGQLQLDVTPATPKTPTIQIGGRGKGTFNLGNTGKTGQIYEVGGGGSVVVRGTPTGDGSLIGWGPVKLKGVLVNNGQVVADGYRHERTLDLSSFSGVGSSIENPRFGGTNGWFARREGQLKLPAVHVNPGDGTYTWGENSDDLQIDLVNSVRFTMHDARQTGDVAIALLSPLRDDIPTLPGGHHFIGVWSFDGSELGGFSRADLQVRYDDALANELGLDEQILKLWRFDPATMQWARINDETFSRDTVDHILSGTAVGNFTYFAVSAPEPGTMTLMGIAASALLMRRRRRG